MSNTVDVGFLLCGEYMMNLLYQKFEKFTHKMITNYVSVTIELN